MFGSIIRKFVLVSSVLVVCASAANFTDSRTNKSYKLLPSGKLNWFLSNVGTMGSEGVPQACPAGSRVPGVEEWNSIFNDKFTGPRKKPNLKSFAGKIRGYTVPGDKKVKGKDAAYFAIGGQRGMKAAMLDTKRGVAKMVDLPESAVVAVRCVVDRDFYAEKNISKKDMKMTDPRDQQQYPVEVRGTKVWMTSNLRYGLVSAKQCFLEDTVFCKRHGRFFMYNEAKKACPQGWHLPDDGEWRDFQKDWSKLDWNNLGRGGCKDWDEYCDENATGHYWSATSVKKNTGRSWEFRREAHSINRTDESIQKGLYVRCVTDLE